MTDLGHRKETQLNSQFSDRQMPASRSRVFPKRGHRQLRAQSNETPFPRQKPRSRHSPVLEKPGYVWRGGSIKPRDW